MTETFLYTKIIISSIIFHTQTMMVIEILLVTLEGSPDLE